MITHPPTTDPAHRSTARARRSPGATRDPVAAFDAALASHDTPTTLSLIDAHWTTLLFHPRCSAAVFDALADGTAEDFELLPRASLLAEGVGVLPPGTTALTMPANAAELEATVRSGRARQVLETAILAMVSDRVHGALDRATEIARRSRPLLAATSGTRFSPNTDLHSYWHLQAGQAALQAGDLTRAGLDLGHAWASRGDDVTGYSAPSSAPLCALVATVVGELEAHSPWRAAWSAMRPATAHLIDADTMERPVHVGDLLLASDRLAPGAEGLSDGLHADLLHDELWPLTLWVLVRHHIDAGAHLRAEVLVRSCLDRHPAPGRVGTLRHAFVGWARAELALAAGRLQQVTSLLDPDHASPLPGLTEIYHALAHLHAGDHVQARRMAVAAERKALHPRVLRESRHLVAACDRASDLAAGVPTSQPLLAADLRRLDARLPTALQVAPPQGAVTPLRLPVQGELLTPAERRTLVALAEPGTLAAAAQRLHLSPNTLKTQARGIYRKLGVASRDEMVAVARRDGLLD